MENFKKLLRLAKRLELKYIIAQPATSGQDEAVRQVLQDNGLLDTNLAAPFISQAGIPDDAVVNIAINVKPGYSVSFTSTAVPHKPDRGNFPPGPPGDEQFKTEMADYNKKVPAYAALAQKLSLLLLKNLSPKMFTALKKASPPVTDLVKINWAEFK